MTEGARLADLLARIPTRRMRRRLVRCVPQLDFDDSDTPSYLYTSGRPNRCNPAGVECLYFSETEATAQAEEQWVEHVRQVAGLTLFPQANSWYLGANIPGKQRVFMPYVGGLLPYRQRCAEVAESGYPGFELRP